MDKKRPETKSLSLQSSEKGLGVRKGFLGEGVLELKQGGRGQGTRRGSGVAEEVYGDRRVMLGTERGFVITE